MVKSKKQREKERKKKLADQKKAASAPDTIKKEKAKEPEIHLRRWGNQFDLKYTDQQIEKIADEMVDFFKTDPQAVYFTDFSIDKMISRQRFYEFEKKNKYFAHCFQLVRDIIISRFTKFGLGGKNAAFPIFGLKNIAREEFKDRHEHQVSGGLKIIKDDIK